MPSRLFCCFGCRIHEEQFYEERKNKCDESEQKYQSTASNKGASAKLTNRNKVPRTGDVLSQEKLQKVGDSDVHNRAENCNRKNTKSKERYPSCIPKDELKHGQQELLHSNTIFQVDYKQETQIPSTSCPQLTVDEPTNSLVDSDEDNSEMHFTEHSQTSDTVREGSSSLKCRFSGVPSNQVSITSTEKTRNDSGFISVPSKSLLTKTYSFKRIISFRGENLRRGIINNSSNVGGAYSPSNHGRTSPLPCYPNDHLGGCHNPSNFNTYKPLTFSFLGQIYAKNSIKGDKSISSCKKKHLEAKLSSSANSCDDSANMFFVDDSAIKAESCDEHQS